MGSEAGHARDQRLLRRLWLGTAAGALLLVATLLAWGVGREREHVQAERRGVVHQGVDRVADAARGLTRAALLIAARPDDRLAGSERLSQKQQAAAAAFDHLASLAVARPGDPPDALLPSTLNQGRAALEELSAAAQRMAVHAAAHDAANEPWRPAAGADALLAAEADLLAVLEQAGTRLDARSAALLEREHARQGDLGLLAAGLLGGLLGLVTGPALREFSRRSGESAVRTRALEVQQQLLADSELRLRLAVNAAEIGLWQWDRRTDRATCDERLYTMLGYSPGEFPPDWSAWLRLVHPADRADAERAARALLAGTSAELRVEYRLQTRGGGWKWVLLAGRALERAEDGTALRLAGIHRDVDAEKRARLEAAEHLARLERAESQARLGHWSFDVASGQVRWSRGVFELFGRDPAAGEPDYPGALAMYAPESARVLAEAVRQAIGHGRAYELTLRVAGDEERYLQAVGNVRRDAHGATAALFGTVMEVTDRVLRERQLAAAVQAAQDACRVKSDFLANMSHEIRTPMTAILGFAEMLRDDPDVLGDAAERHEALEAITRNGAHLLAVINDILDLSKIEADKLMLERITVDPLRVVDEVITLLRPRAAARGLVLERCSGPAVPAAMRSDPVRLRQILLNLVGNAVKFTPAGSVTVTIAGGPGPSGPNLQIEVRDTGIGMNAEQLARCFGAFEQADASMARRFGGTGLGLRISKRLAELLGGDIHVNSTPGQGSAFTLILPVEVVTPQQAGPDSATRPAAPAAAPQRPPLEGVRLLLAEDGPDNQKLITAVLRKSGAEVSLASDGRACVERALEAERRGPPFDAIVMDMQMPELDGYAAARALREAGYPRPIVALTAHAMAGDRERCLAAGCSAYSTKPIDRQRLVATLAGCLAAASVVDTEAQSGPAGRGA